MKFLIPFFAVLLTACSQGTSQTNAVIAITGAVTGNTFNMLYGRHSSGKSFAKKFGPSDEQVSIELADGQWEFAMLTWDGANPYEGNAKCYYGTADLNGTPVTINAQATAAGCSNAIFGGVDTTPSNSGSDLRPLSFYNCSSIDNVSSFSSACPELSRGFNRSFKIALTEYNEFAGSTQTAAYSSNCISTSDSDGITATALKIPFGDTKSVFSMLVRSYDGFNCAGSVDTSLVRRGLQDPDSKTYTTSPSTLITYFEDKGFLDNITVLSSISASGSNLGQYLAKIPSNPPTYVYRDGSFQSKVYFSQLEKDDAASVFLSAPTNASYSATSGTPITANGTVFFGADADASSINDLYTFSPQTYSVKVTPAFTGSAPCGVRPNAVYPSANGLFFLANTGCNGSITDKSVCFSAGASYSCPVDHNGVTGIEGIGVYNNEFYFTGFTGGNWQVMKMTEAGVSSSQYTLPNYTVNGTAGVFTNSSGLYAILMASATPYPNYLIKIAGSVTLEYSGVTTNARVKTPSGNTWLVFENASGQVPGFVPDNGAAPTILTTGFSNATDVVIFGQVGTKLVFSADNDGGGANNTDLYTCNATTGGGLTSLVDHPNSIPSYTHKIFNGLLYFQGNDGTNGDEPWTYDGTNPPAILSNIASSSSSSYPSNFTTGLGKLFFVANDGTFNRLVVTDGTPGGTSLVSTAIDNPSNLIASSNYLYFVGSESSNQRVYRTTGTTDTTTRLFSNLTNFATGVFPWESRVHIQLYDTTASAIHHLSIAPVQ